MKLLLEMDQDVVERINECWDYLHYEFQLNLWPEFISPIVEYSLITTINELIIFHYLYDYDLEEYLHKSNWMGIRDLVTSIFIADEDHGLYQEFISSYESLNCTGNPLASYITRNARSLELYSDEGFDGTFDYDDMIDTLEQAVIFSLEDALRSVDILSSAPKLSDAINSSYSMKPTDVFVDITRRRLIVQH